MTTLLIAVGTSLIVTVVAGMWRLSRDELWLRQAPLGRQLDRARRALRESAGRHRP